MVLAVPAKAAFAAIDKQEYQLETGWELTGRLSLSRSTTLFLRVRSREQYVMRNVR
jgi:hypothetical protein